MPAPALFTTRRKRADGEWIRIMRLLSFSSLCLWGESPLSGDRRSPSLSSLFWHLLVFVACASLPSSLFAIAIGHFATPGRQYTLRALRLHFQILLSSLLRARARTRAQYAYGERTGATVSLKLPPLSSPLWALSSTSHTTLWQHCRSSCHLPTQSRARRVLGE